MSTTNWEDWVRILVAVLYNTMLYLVPGFAGGLSELGAWAALDSNYLINMEGWPQLGE
jgi:hypothetical protein